MGIKPRRAVAAIYRDSLGVETQVKQEFDQNRLCCGKLFEAELDRQRVILKCLACGTQWAQQSDGSLAPLALSDPFPGAGILEQSGL